MGQFRISEAAGLFGVSDDTIRRWARANDLPVGVDTGNRQVIDGAVLAGFARDHSRATPDALGRYRSARNRLVGLVTSVVADGVMAQVEIVCGPVRVVSVMSAAAVADLGLEPGALAVAVVKATDVIVETPAPTPVSTPRSSRHRSAPTVS